MGDDIYSHLKDNRKRELILFYYILKQIMAVDPRLIMSGQFAEHLWLTSASNGTTNYFINKKGKRGGPDNTYEGGEVKMGKNEDRTIKNILSSVSTTDILNFKQEKNRKYSQWDITKVSGFSDSNSKATSSVATFPFAPGAKGQPPNPPAELSN